MGPPLRNRHAIPGVQGGGGTPCEDPAHLPITRLAKPSRGGQDPRAGVNLPPGRGAMLASTTSIHPPGVGAFPPSPAHLAPCLLGSFIRLAPARSDNSPGGDPAAQRGLPREGSPLTPGLTRPEDKQLQIAPSPFPAGAAAVRPSSRLRCSPVRLDKRDARPELFGFVPYVQEKDAQGIPAALLADAPHSEGF